MRPLVIVTVLALGAGCAPDIAPGTYLCGPEQLCPDGQACNGPDNVCVNATSAQPFACGMKYEDVEGDDTPATGQPQGELPCVSTLQPVLGCITPGDSGDFYAFSTPSTCVAVKVTAALEYPLAFASLELLFAEGGGPTQAVETPCPPSHTTVEGHASRCFEMTLAPGMSYALGVARDGTADCDGACAYNRYVLDFALATP